MYSTLAVLIVMITVGSVILLSQGGERSQTENETKSQTKEHKNVHIAIVNEDQATKYNGQEVELGKPFIKRLAQEDRHKFETISRSAAENGLKNGSYHVMVVIPKDFSKKAMQLDKKTPTEMAIQYKTAVGQKAQLAKETEQVVGDVLNTFNKNLINIYLTSIIDNLHNAQGNVDKMMKRQERVDQKFSQYLLNPLNDFPEHFTDVFVNALSANNHVSSWMSGYNNSLLSANSNIFGLNTNHSASTLLQDQNRLFDSQLSALTQTLDDYKAQKSDVDIERYISQLKHVNDLMDKQNEGQQKSKDAYKALLDEYLEEMKASIEDETSPFTEDMLKDYREKLKASLLAQLKDDDALSDTFKDMQQGHQKLKDAMLNTILKTIQDDQTGEDPYYIRDLTPEDIAQAGLSDKETKAYQDILSELKTFKAAYHKAHPDDRIVQDKYKGEIAAGDTTKLVNEGVSLERKQRIKGKDINGLTVATDPRFNFEGEIDVNGKKYDIKDQSTKLDTTEKTYDVEIKGTAKLKRDQESAFLKDKTMHLQVLFGHANSEDGTDGQNNRVSVVEMSMHHNLEGHLISAHLHQQLRSLDRFQSEYDMYKASNFDNDKSDIDQDAIVDLFVDQVIKDMDSFKTDKDGLLEQIDHLAATSDAMVEELVLALDANRQRQKDIQETIAQLENVHQHFSETPAEPKLDKSKGDTFTTLSSQLDDDVRKLAERSSTLLNDTQKSKSSADHIASELSKLEQNANNLHASGRSLGTRANDLNKQMASNAEENKLFAKNFEDVLKHSKDGDRQNEMLKAFMSHPIQKKNLGNVLADSESKDAISATMLVLIMYVLAMMTAYGFYSYENTRGGLNIIKNDFSQRNGLWNNIVVSGVITGVALIEGLIIGIIALNKYGVLSGYRMTFFWMVLLVMVVFVLWNTYLLRQLKVIGMFVMLMLLITYFMTMTQLRAVDTNSVLSKISPLSRIDTLFYNYLNAEHTVAGAILTLILFIVVGFILNMFIKSFKKATKN